MRCKNAGKIGKMFGTCKIKQKIVTHTDSYYIGASAARPLTYNE
jgi:hypothetical protein